jgi:hypothetical protein
MNKIPFSVYDFFGYLAPGFVLLAAFDFSSDGGWLLRDNQSVAMVFFWIAVAYFIGHLIAHISSILLEDVLVRRILTSPEVTLFIHRKTRWRYIFPGFYRQLPPETAKRVLQKASQIEAHLQPGRGLFFHCHAIVKHQSAVLERLTTFLNLYGLCRNVSLSSFLAAGILGFGSYWSYAHCLNFWPKLYWSVAALILSFGMLYRYLKFFRLYTVEVFVSYAET